VTGPAATGKQLDLIGDARTSGVDEPEDRQLVTQGVLGEAHDLLDGARPPRSRLDGRIVGHDTHRTTVDPPGAGDDAIGRQVTGRGHRVGQQRVLDERAVIEEQRDAIADKQLVLRGQLLALRIEVAGEGALCRLR
jgi:hypothetical protein